MALTLTPEVEQRVNEKVASGAFPSADDVIRTGLRFIEEQEAIYQEKMEALRRELAIGVAQLDSGDVTKVTSAAEWAAETEARGRKLLAERQAAKP